MCKKMMSVPWWDWWRSWGIKIEQWIVWGCICHCYLSTSTPFYIFNWFMGLCVNSSQSPQLFSMRRGRSGEDLASTLKSMIWLHMYLTISLCHHVYRSKFTVSSVQSRENQHFPSFIQQLLSWFFAKTMTADSNSRHRCLPASLETPNLLAHWMNDYVILHRRYQQDFLTEFELW